MADDNKTSNPPAHNPAKAVSTPQLPTKSVRDDGNKVHTYPPMGGKK